MKRETIRSYYRAAPKVICGKKPKKKDKDEDEAGEENPQDAPARCTGRDAPAVDAPAGSSDDAARRPMTGRSRTFRPRNRRRLTHQASLRSITCPSCVGHGESAGGEFVSQPIARREITLRLCLLAFSGQCENVVR